MWGNALAQTRGVERSAGVSTELVLFCAKFLQQLGLALKALVIVQIRLYRLIGSNELL